MGVIPRKRGDCQNGRNRAFSVKMAAAANVVPNANIFSAYFFCLTFKIRPVEYRYT